MLYQYVKNENRSRAGTVAVIKENHQSLDKEKYDVSKFINRMKKFKQLSVKSNFDSFKSFCEEKFTMVGRMSNPTSTAEEEHMQTAINQQTEIYNQPNELSALDDPSDIRHFHA